MKDRKLQVFVSSTYLDLKEERQAAVEAILTAGHIPAGMELFTAGDESQMEVIKRWIDESDVYLLILGGRYGSIEKNSEKSYTHLEYDYAVEKKKALFAIVMSDEALEKKVMKIQSTSIKENENPQKLKEFKSLVTSNLVKFWSDERDIKIAILETLREFGYRKELSGWVRGGADMELVAQQLALLVAENTKLKEELENSARLKGDSGSFAGLSFSEIKNWLSSKVLVGVNGGFSLLEFLKNNGRYFIPGGLDESYRGVDENAARLLVEIKLLRRNAHHFLYTEEGHNFHARMLVSLENE